MQVTDSNGQVIEVENLQLAIMQADDFRHYRHADTRHSVADDRLNAYWQDIYEKLVALQESA